MNKGSYQLWVKNSVSPILYCEVSSSLCHCFAPDVKLYCGLRDALAMLEFSCIRSLVWSFLERREEIVLPGFLAARWPQDPAPETSAYIIDFS